MNDTIVTEPEVFDISVTNPEVAQKSSFSIKHVNYRVLSKTNVPEIRGDVEGIVEKSVIRRYSDFKWLSVTLSTTFPGAIIPPLPDKTSAANKALEIATAVLSSVEELDDEYVEARRIALEKFLAVISKHPELRASAPVVSFVKDGDEEFKKVKDDLQPKSMTSSVVDVFNSSIFTISTGGMKVGHYIYSRRHFNFKKCLLFYL